MARDDNDHTARASEGQPTFDAWWHLGPGAKFLLKNILDNIGDAPERLTREQATLNLATIAVMLREILSKNA